MGQAAMPDQPPSGHTDDDVSMEEVEDTINHDEPDSYNNSSQQPASPSTPQTPYQDHGEWRSEGERDSDEDEWQLTPNTGTIKKVAKYRSSLRCPECDERGSLVMRGNVRNGKIASCSGCSQRTSGRKLLRVLTAHASLAEHGTLSSPPPQTGNETSVPTTTDMPTFMDVVMKRMDSQDKLISELRDNFRTVMTMLSQNAQVPTRPVARRLKLPHTFTPPRRNCEAETHRLSDVPTAHNSSLQTRSTPTRIPEHRNSEANTQHPTGSHTIRDPLTAALSLEDVTVGTRDRVLNLQKKLSENSFTNTIQSDTPSRPTRLQPKALYFSNVPQGPHGQIRRNLQADLPSCLSSTYPQ